MNRELQQEGERARENGDVWGSQSRGRGLHKPAFRSPVGVLFVTGRGEEEERGRERKNQTT